MLMMERRPQWKDELIIFLSLDNCQQSKWRCISTGTPTLQSCPCGGTQGKGLEVNLAEIAMVTEFQENHLQPLLSYALGYILVPLELALLFRSGHLRCKRWVQERVCEGKHDVLGLYGSEAGPSGHSHLRTRLAFNVQTSGMGCHDSVK